MVLAHDLDWTRHVIGLPGTRPDDPSKTANPDGVRLADLNGDGLQDIAVGFEYGEYARVYFHPGKEKVRSLWDTIIVHPSCGAAEDASFVDVNNDGKPDVVICAEGGGRVSFAFAPADGDPADAALWTASSSVSIAWEGADKRFNLPGSAMWAEPADVDQDGDTDLIVGGKGKLSWLEAPDHDDAKNNVNLWKAHNIGDSSWTMSIVVTDLNHDGYPDFLLTDRRAAGGISVCWVENPGPRVSYEGKNDPDWTKHTLRGQDDARFARFIDLDRDGLKDFIVAIGDKGTDPSRLVWYKQNWDEATRTVSFVEHSVVTGIPDAHGIGAGDLNGDGKIDIVISHTGNPLRVLEHSGDPTVQQWTQKTLKTDKFGKHDTYTLYDVDRDGDLDILTTSENLYGVIWFENPGTPDLSEKSLEAAPSPQSGYVDLKWDSPTDTLSPQWTPSLVNPDWRDVDQRYLTEDGVSWRAVYPTVEAEQMFFRLHSD